MKWCAVTGLDSRKGLCPVRTNERKRIWVEHFQTMLALRIAGYFVVFVLVFINCLFAWRLLREGPSDVVQQFIDMLLDYAPVFICLALLTPIICWDAIRFTHRLVGPLVRVRRTMISIAERELVPPIKLREGDYLTEFRDEFNAMLESLEARGISVLKQPDGPNPRPSFHSGSAARQGTDRGCSS
jgi:hypothetical protein